jgi:hypothetical protein
LLSRLLAEAGLHHTRGLEGRVAPGRAGLPLKAYPVADFLRAHGLLQNQLLLQVGL